MNTTSTVVDLTPVLNTIIQAVGILVGALAVPLALFCVNWVRHRMNLAQLELDAELRAKLDAGAQKVIGGAFAKVELKPGQAVLDVKNEVVAKATQALADNFGDTIKALGSKDVAAKAAEVVENRLGLMLAEQNGTPVPNPSKPDPQQVTVTPTPPPPVP